MAAVSFLHSTSTVEPSDSMLKALAKQVMTELGMM